MIITTIFFKSIKKGGVLKVIAFAFCFASLSVKAVTNTATAKGGGTWATATWSQGHIPLVTEDVVVNSGVSIKIITAAVCKSLTLGNVTNKATTLTLSPGGSLAVTGNVTLNPSAVGKNFGLKVTTQTATIGGTIIFPTTNTGLIQVSTGSITISGAVNVSADGKLLVAGSGTCTCNGLVTLSGGIIANNTSAGTYNFAAGLTCSSGTFNSISGENIELGNNLNCSRAGGLAFNASSTVTFTGNSTITPTTAITFGNIIINGSVITTLAGSIFVKGNWTDNGTFTPGVNSVTLNGAGTTQLINTAETFYALLATNASGIIQLNANVIITNQLGMSSPNFNLNGFTLTLGNSSTLASLTYTGGILYGGIFERWWPALAITSNSGNYYGFFPIGTSTSYNPLTINSTTPPVTPGYVSVAYNSSTTVTSVAYTDNEGTAIQRISNENTTVTTSLLAGGAYTIGATFSGFDSLAASAITDYRLETYTGGVMGSAGTSSESNWIKTPVLTRSGLTAAQLGQVFVAGTKNLTNTPIYAFYYSIANNNWSTLGTWSYTSGGASCACTPINTASVVVENNYTVTLTSATTADYLTLQTGGDLAGASSISLNDNLTITGAGRLSTTGSATVTGTTSISGSGASTSGGTTTLSGAVTIGTGASLTMTGGAGLTLANNVTVNGTLGVGTGTTSMTGASTLDGAGSITGTGTFQASNSISTAATASLTITPTFNVFSNQTVTQNGIITLSGNLTGSSANSTWAMSDGSVLNIAGSVFNSNGTLDPNSCGCSNTVNYNGAGAQTIVNPSGSTYATLECSTSGIKSLPGGAVTITINNAVQLSGSVILSEGTSTLSDNAGNADLTMSGTSELQLTRSGNNGSVQVPELNGNYALSAGTGIYIDESAAGAGNAIMLNSTGTGSYWDVYLTEASVAGNYDLSDGGVGDIVISDNLYVQGTSVIATIAGGLTVSNLFDYTSSGTTTLDDNLTTGSLTINGSGTLNDGGNNIVLNAAAAAWTLTSGTYTTTGLTEFEGSGTETVTGVTAFNNLTLNTASANDNLTLNNNESVHGILTLTKGKLLLNNNTLTINNSSTSAVVRTSGYIVSDETASGTNTSIVTWNMGVTTGNFVFPFGTLAAGTIIPFTFNKTTATASNVSVSTRATVSNNTPFAGASDGGAIGAVTLMNNLTTGLPEAASDVIDRWWDIQSSAAVTANLTFSYDGVENTTTTSPAGLFGAQHWNGTSWDPIVGSGTGITASGSVGTVAVTGANTFSPWVLVTLSNPLPIQLISFTAECNNYSAQLKWSTATETNNDHFIVERTQDGIHYETVAVVKGSGNSTTERDYSDIDQDPLPGTSYYRLSQTDLDGNTTYLNTIVYVPCENENSVRSFTANNMVKVQINAVDNGENYTIVLFNSVGQQMYEKKVTAAEGLNSYSINSQDYSRGIYIIEITGNKTVYTHKVVLGL